MWQIYSRKCGGFIPENVASESLSRFFLKFIKLNESYSCYSDKL